MSTFGGGRPPGSGPIGGPSSGPSSGPSGRPNIGPGSAASGDQPVSRPSIGPGSAASGGPSSNHSHDSGNRSNSESSGGGGGRPVERDRGPKRGGKDGGLRVNREIRAPEVRVIDEDGTMLGVFPPSEALRMAEAKGLDLIEIAPTAKPPTCKITDYGKYKYEAKKKEHQARKNQTVITIKEIQLRPRTDQHDLDVKMKHARRFILEGDKVKVNLRFYGREMAHQEVGFELLKRVIRALNDVAMVETNPKMEGRQLFVLLTPDLAKLKDIEKAAQKEADAAARAAGGGSKSEAKLESKSESKSEAKADPKSEDAGGEAKEVKAKTPREPKAPKEPKETKESAAEPAKASADDKA